MKILTWNINGIRAAQGKFSLKKVLDDLCADVICLQETKITRDMMDEPTAIVDGYESYFSFSRKRTGYSGTANYCVTAACPCKAEEGLSGRLTKQNKGHVGCYGDNSHFSDDDLDALDAEGRCVITQHKIRLHSNEVKDVAVINVYVPRSGDREDRHIYKLQFLTLLQIRAEALLKDGIHVIVLGDLNLTHRQLDNCQTESFNDSNRQPSRIWMNQFLQQSERDSNLPSTDYLMSDMENCYSSEGGHFSDVFRHLHPNQESAFTNWCTLTGARQTNYGRRLDYILIDKGLAQYVTQCDIMSDFEGSDHCPVVVTLDCETVPYTESPPLCSKLMPEFKGQQQKLSSFFSSVSKPSANDNPSTESATQESNSRTPVSLKQDLKIVEPQKNILKRSGSKQTQIPLKKQKSKTNDSSSKQSNLKSFFSRPNACESNSKSGLSAKEVNSKNLNITDKTNSEHIQISSSEVEKNAKFSNLLPSVSEMPDAEIKQISQETTTSTSNSDQHSRNDCPDSNSQTSKPMNSGKSSQAWKNLLKGLPPTPLCPGHKEPCVLRTVKKEGRNRNKQFYVCARPEGSQGNKEARCNFFQWLSDTKQK